MVTRLNSNSLNFSFSVVFLPLNILHINKTQSRRKKPQKKRQRGNPHRPPRKAHLARDVALKYAGANQEEWGIKR